jgi:hypothetical protein
MRRRGIPPRLAIRSTGRSASHSTCHPLGQPAALPLNRVCAVWVSSPGWLSVRPVGRRPTRPAIPSVSRPRSRPTGYAPSGYPAPLAIRSTGRSAIQLDLLFTLTSRPPPPSTSRPPSAPARHPARRGWRVTPPTGRPAASSGVPGPILVQRCLAKHDIASPPPAACGRSDSRPAATPCRRRYPPPHHTALRPRATREHGPVGFSLPCA